MSPPIGILPHKSRRHARPALWQGDDRDATGVSSFRMSQLLRRFHAPQERLSDLAKIDRILEETTDVGPTSTVARATLPGDPRRLRGIPVCAMGVGGVAPGTNPLAEV